MKNQATITGGIITAVILATAAATCAQPLKKITIGLSSSGISAAAPSIAKAMGLFEKHGLDATVTAMDTGAVANAALVSGQINFSSSGPTDVVVAAARGQDVVALCADYRGFAGVLVLAKSVVEKLGVSPTAPLAERAKALNGFLIASPSPTSTFTFASKPLAEAYGATFRFTYMALAAMPAALEAGAIQGYVGSASNYLRNISTGTGVIWISGPKGEFPPEFTPVNSVTINAYRSYVKDNPDIARRVCDVFVAELSKAVKERPEDVKAAISRAHPDFDRATIDFLYEADSSLGFVTRPLTKEDMAHEIDFVKKSGADVKTDQLDPARLVLAP